MLLYYGVCTAAFGLIFGSFLNCMAMRIVRKEDFVRGRSHCMSCGHELSAGDLIPLFSWLIHKGRCRYCGEKISVRYPLAESAFSVLSLILYIAFIGCKGGFSIGAVITFFEYWFLTGCLFALTLTDLEDLTIPDGVILAGVINWGLFTALEIALGIKPINWMLHHLLAGFLVGAVMLILSLIMDRMIRKESLGGGDMKLYALLGLYLGYAGSYELVMLSCFLGLVFVAVRKVMNRESSAEFPFGPSIALAGYILLMASDTITNWYFGTLL